MTTWTVSGGAFTSDVLTFNLVPQLQGRPDLHTMGLSLV